MANKNAQKRNSKSDYFGMGETAFGATAPTTDCKFFLTKTALGFNSSIADAVLPSGAAWVTGVLKVYSKNSEEPISIDLDVSGDTVTTAITNAQLATQTGETRAELTLVDDTGAQSTASAWFTFGDLVATDVVYSIGNEQ